MEVTTIGQRIRILIEEKEKKSNQRIKDNDVAKATGIGRGKLSMILNDYVDPANGKVRTFTEPEILSLCDYFGVSPTFLLLGKDDENVLVSKDLGLSNDTINNLRQMDTDTLKAFESLINHEEFGMALISFFSSEKQGLWLNGRQIAQDFDDINIGNPHEYSEFVMVSDLVASHRQRYLLQLLQEIKRQRSADR